MSNNWGKSRIILEKFDIKYAEFHQMKISIKMEEIENHLYV